MVDWTDVRAMIAEEFLVARDQERSLTVALRSGGGRPQRVEVELLRGRARVQLALVAEVGPLRSFDAGEALRYNAESEHGALVARGGACALRQLLPLDGVSAAVLRGAVRALAAEADRLRGERPARRPTHAVPGL